MTQAQYTAIVTGGSTGIGEDICRKMLDQGYTVISMARNVLPWTHERLHCVQVDLLDAAATEKAAKDIAERFDVTHFIHNAGVIWPALLDEVKLEDLQGLTQIHLGAALQITQAVVPGMRERHFGRIVLMSSRGALGLQTRTAYAATKAGMLGMARTWALELADQGITVNVIAPGPITTNMFYDVVEAGSEREAKLAASIPVKRLGRADDISRATMFFSDPENSFITGQTLYVCGGASVGTLII
ncbi:SDR family oxidoreductase [Alcaligenes ammonioxydans]|jgi:3-oxoacyl-[acyl-carrier protein] reductase|uniref:SDR family oxidoreductase n=1 Tax=Alcaligenes ammonioxydans TaxID=2582914 RepID=A0ABX8SPJ6_9BURK|nr:SDR family oxidoreductase [Alcaligenes ammonioxydans]EJC65114.1 short-chain dehydrogenase [Alcaligenes faecalis subsp. faecalis NCIB 8687]QBH19585.1 SDR family oxidoreductase [Alcaligenes faecalis]MCH1880015.1 SDR family oxidoreductase [Alcaligenes ammonioxydans]QXX77594.1 SDR family oxidoreductase [Alcaligenes ammonioxydans]WGQ35640.1 SDR family oxidoreductase [Alcaligenes faecalis]